MLSIPIRNKKKIQKVENNKDFFPNHRRRCYNTHSIFQKKHKSFSRYNNWMHSRDLLSFNSNLKGWNGVICKGKFKENHTCNRWWRQWREYDPGGPHRCRHHRSWRQSSCTFQWLLLWLIPLSLAFIIRAWPLVAFSHSLFYKFFLL